MANNAFFPVPPQNNSNNGFYGGGGGDYQTSQQGPYGTSSSSSAAAPSNSSTATPSSNNDDWFTPSASTTTTSSMTGSSSGGGGAGMYNSGVTPSANSGGAYGYNSGVPQQQHSQHHPPAQPAANVFNPAAPAVPNLSGPMGSSSSTSDPQLSGSMSGPMGSSPSSNSTNGDDEDYENEPPLMEELGVNLPHIAAKSKAVLLPVGHTASIDVNLMADTDLAGPLFYALCLGGELLLAGKMHFGYIYGFGMFGCLAMTLVVNLMSPNSEAISAWTVISILGYCLLPVNMLAVVNILFRIQNRGILGWVLGAVTILWCTVASTRLFERSCEMRDQRYLMAYPSMLLYSCFVMITVF